MRPSYLVTRDCYGAMQKYDEYHPPPPARARDPAPFPPPNNKVDEMVFPGMTRRFRIFEPRYRALVKLCLAEDVPLVLLPLSKGGNTVATTARVTGLYNVEEDGR